MDARALSRQKGTKTNEITYVQLEGELGSVFRQSFERRARGALAVAYRAMAEDIGTGSGVSQASVNNIEQESSRALQPASESLYSDSNNTGVAGIQPESLYSDSNNRHTDTL